MENLIRVGKDFSPFLPLVLILKITKILYLIRKRKSELDVSIHSTGKQSGRGGGTPVKDSNGNLNSSISSAQSTNAELSKRQRRAEKLAKKEEKKNASRQDSKESRESKEEEKFHRTGVMYPCLSDLRVPQLDVLDDASVMG